MGAKTIDEYLAGVAPELRAALETLRGQIGAAAPGAEECVSYGQPAFRKGRVVCGFGATKKHCALYGESMIYFCNRFYVILVTTRVTSSIFSSG